jgi:hypothetical protein
VLEGPVGIGWIVEGSAVSRVEAMTKEEEFERRLVALEQAVAEIQRRLVRMPDPDNGLDRVIGSVTDVEAFEEALKYGREFRHADRSPDEDIDLGRMARS